MLERIGVEVDRTLGRLGPEASLGPLVAAWPGAVGPQIAANAWPSRLARDGTLHVAASSSAWAFELGQLEGEIRSRLVAALGREAPPRLRFAPGPLPEGGRESVSSPSRNIVEVDDAARVEGARLAAGIADPDLRELVARAAAASLASGRSRRPL